MSNPTGIVLSSIKVLTPTLNIRNSKGIVHTTSANQQVWSGAPGSEPIVDGDGSFFPASKSIAAKYTGKGVRLALQFTGSEQTVWDLIKKSNLQLTGTDSTGNGVILDQTLTTDPSGSATVVLGFAPSYAIPNNLPWGFAGDVTWTWAIPGHDSIVQVTRLELYSLCDTLPAFFHGVVSVQFLRKMVLPARLTTGQTWTDYVVNAAFSKFGYKYEISFGSPKFTNGYKGWSFDLRRWVKGVGRNNLINCYDQAAIVEVALGLGPPLKTEWMYMWPYGFIKSTYLVGYPETKCNNPIAETPDRLFLKNNNDPTRKPFGNHAFVRVDGKIADACAGPHTGTETLEEYIANAIQSKDETTLYDAKDPKIRRPGTKDDATPYRGVTGLDVCDIKDPAHDFAPTPNSLIAMAAASANLKLDDAKYGAALKSFQDVIDKVDKTFTLDVFVSSLGVEMTWDIPNAANSTSNPETEITIFVCEKSGRAVRMFENTLHESTAPFVEFLEKPSGTAATDVYGDILSQLMLASKTVPNTTSTLVNCFVSWVRGNVTVIMTGAAKNAADLFTSCRGQDIDNVIKAKALQNNLPNLEELSITMDNDPVKNGETVELDSGETFTLTVKLGFNSDHFSFTDTAVNINGVGKEEAATNPIVLRNSTPTNQEWVFELGTPTAQTADTSDHPLEFVFAERETSRVVTVKLGVAVKNTPAAPAATS